MLTLSEFTKSDALALLEGFSTSFLKDPLIKPAKSLMEFITKGFRVNKLNRNQMIKVFCNAILAREVSITNYILKEIKSNFNNYGIMTILDEADVNNNEGQLRAICRVETVLRSAGLQIPADIALLLCGKRCTDEIKELSRNLYMTYLDSINTAKEEGKSHAVVMATSALEAEQKKTEKLAGTLNEEKLAHKHSLEKISEKITEISDLKINIQNLNKELQQEQLKSEAWIKQVDKIKKLCEQKESVIETMSIQVEQLNKSVSELNEKDMVIQELEIKLAEAESLSFSPDLIKDLCNEVICELHDKSLGREKIYEISCGIFDETVSIEDAWLRISEESLEKLKHLLKDFSIKKFNDSQLDELTLIENYILIKFLTVKSLKTLLYQNLENINTNRTINENFSN